MLNLNRITFLALLVFLFVASALPHFGLAGGGINGKEVGAIPEIRGYQKWQRLQHRDALRSDLFSWCAASSVQPIDRSKTEISVFANARAFTHLTQKETTPFPLGSVIVREVAADEIKGHPLSLSIMIKRRIGFDERHSDWELLYIDKENRVSRGAKHLKSCYECHQTGGNTEIISRDQVFVSTYKFGEPHRNP